MSQRKNNPSAQFNRVFSKRPTSAVFRQSLRPADTPPAEAAYEEHIQGFLKDNRIVARAAGAGDRERRLLDVHAAMEDYLKAQTRSLLEQRARLRELDALTDELVAWCIQAPGYSLR